jgi:hypothetical protein
MPALKHVSRVGDLKAQLSALQVGEALVVPSEQRAEAFRVTARRAGVLVSIVRARPGEPEHVVRVHGTRPPVPGARGARKMKVGAIFTATDFSEARRIAETARALGFTTHTAPIPRKPCGRTHKITITGQLQRKAVA